MALPVTIPNAFANATASIPLSQLDTNFNTLANAVNGISDGSETLANVTATVANITTANVGALNTSGAVVFNDAGADVDFRVEGDTEANLLFVDASADAVGIGTNTPVRQLSILGTGVATDGIQLTTTATGNTATDGTSIYVEDSDSGLRIIQRESSAIQFFTAANSGGGERMRIDSNGNPLFRFTSSAVYDTNTSADVAQFWNMQTGSANSTATKAMLATTSDGGYFGAATENTANKNVIQGFIGVINSDTTAGSEDGYIIFATQASGTSAAERMRIDSSGNLLVGTTTQGSNEKVRVNTTLNNGWSVLMSSVNRGWLNRQSNASGGIAAYFEVGAGNTVVGAITTSATTTAYVTSSDYRLKENVAPMTGAFAKVLELKPVTYTWKVDGSAGEGFIAHELQTICPDAVSGEKDGEEMQGVDYGRITPLLTAALQEAIAEIQSLKARVAELEAK